MAIFGASITMPRILEWPPLPWLVSSAFGLCAIGGYLALVLSSPARR
ncbi:hypothetical protein ABT294_06410 [Nonomuraea sp. NPDC000554]